MGAVMPPVGGMGAVMSPVGGMGAVGNVTRRGVWVR